MWRIFTLNTVAFLFAFLLSGIFCGALFLGATRHLGSEHGALFFVLIVTFLILFYLSFLFLSILYCRIVSSLLGHACGAFQSSSFGPLLRVTSDVITCHLATPLFSSLPFLLPLMGAKIGRNVVFAGKLFNADLITMGDNVLVGEEAFLCGHIQHKNRLIFGKISIGNDVTIGVRSFLMPDVVVGDHSIVAAYAVVTSGTRIPANEIWGGIPAKRIATQAASA